MKRKYIFFDIDGTLTDLATGKIVPSAQEAVNRLKEAGHFVSICTGRALYKAEAFRSSHGFDHMVSNGGHGLVLTGTVVESEPIDFQKTSAKVIFYSIQFPYCPESSSRDSTFQNQPISSQVL